MQVAPKDGYQEGKRVRVTCPECGRRVYGRAVICHDGCCVNYRVPPHKKKGWWKKGKKVSRSTKGLRRVK